MSVATTSPDVQQAQDEVRPWVRKLARFGFFAKGVVYSLIGILSLQAAVGAGGSTPGPKGVFGTILSQPFGKVLLGLVAVGLLGYGLWRLVEAILDPEGKGNDPKGLATRVGYFASGATYLGFAFSAATSVLGGSSSGGTSSESLTAQVMAQPLGRWLIALIGVGILGAAVYQGYQAYSRDFKKYLKFGEMSGDERRWAVRVGRLGMAARSVVYTIIGWFLLQAAVQYDPQEAGGLGQALSALASQPYGPWLLGMVALGLLAYGIYCFVLARYRRIALP